MEREQTPAPTGTGLSTEDLAQSRDRNVNEANVNDEHVNDEHVNEEAESRPGTPTYPGEATETAGMPAQGDAAPVDDESPQLLVTEDEEGFRSRWQEIQNTFVDDPREAVHAADSLVADVMQKLAATFADHKQDLEEQWKRGEEANTEDLRMTLRKYRSFFNRLLTT
ncbi:hypothetical protein ACWGI8_20505 [Streptomyces sp. NPDC054841]